MNLYTARQSSGFYQLDASLLSSSSKPVDQVESSRKSDLMQFDVCRLTTSC